MSRTLPLSILLAAGFLLLGLRVPALNPDPGGAAGCTTTTAVEDDVRSNEPAGFVPVACLRFDGRDAEDRGRLWPFGRDRLFPAGWDVGERRYLRVDGSGSSAAARALFPRGWKGGSAPVWAERDISRSQSIRLYVSFRLKLSDNWQGHPVNDKLLYVWAHGDPVVFPVYVGGGDASLSTEVRLQDVPGGARNLSPNLASASIERGRWHRWELLLVAGRSGRSDGQVHWWVDGRKVGEHSDVRFGSVEEDRVWERVSWRPVWGGAGGVVQQDQHMWIDDLYASGAP